MQQRGTIITLQLVAAIVLLSGIAVAVNLLHTAHADQPLSFALPLAPLAIAIGLSTALIGIAALLNHRQSGPEEILRTLRGNQAQFSELSSKLDDLAVSIDRIARPRVPTAVTADEETSATVRDRLTGIEHAVGELRDLALLTDAQRIERTAVMKEDRKLSDIRRAIECIEQRQWAQAEQILAAVEYEWPGDATAAHARKDLSEARVQAEADTLVHSEQEIESEMSLGHWDQAVQGARQLAANFPTSVRAINLLSRVQRERGIYTETTVQRLFEEIRREIDHRAWRRALTSAQILLQKFPEHPKSEKIRQQLKTIQDNAEIEERQEQEVRIGELIRARRFHEAIQLGEDLLRRFPMSPQAEAMEIMLPRIHQLAAEADAGASVD